MLQSEFFERTRVYLTGEEYADVEKMYNSTELDKDKFCEEWLKNRDNELVRHLMKNINDTNAYVVKLEDNIKSFEKTIGELKKHIETKLNEMSDKYNSSMEEFGRKMIINFNEESSRYENIEEEFGFDFIVKTKLQEKIELSKEEREYCIRKLQNRR